MKSFLIGCGVVILILIVLGVGGVLYIRSAVKRVSAEMDGAQRSLVATNRDFPFQAPADGKLAEDRLLVWFNVREQALMLEKKRTEQMRTGGFQAMKTAVNMIPAAFKEYETILREAKMSVSEYTWISGQVRGALKSRLAAKDPQTALMSDLINQPSPMMQGARSQPQGSPGPAEQIAPLDSDDAKPVLDLLKKHEAEFRKAATTPFGETMLGGVAASEPRTAPPAEKPATTHTAALAATPAAR